MRKRLISLVALLTLMLCLSVQAGAAWGTDYVAAWQEYGAAETGLTIYKATGTDFLGNPADKFGLKDSKGNVVISAKYDSLEYVNNNRILVRDLTKQWVMNLSGKTVYESAETDITYVKEADVFIISKWNSATDILLDSNLRQIKNAKYPFISHLSHGVFLIEDSDGLRGLYKVGKGELLPTEYTNITVLDWDGWDTGLFMTKRSNRLCGVYDANGNQVLSESYTWFEEYRDGRIIAAKYRKPEYVGLYCDRWNGIEWSADNNELVVAKGMIDAYDEENVLIPFVYDELEFTDDGKIKTVAYTARHVHSKEYVVSGSKLYNVWYTYDKDTNILSMEDVLKNQPKLIDVPTTAYYYDAVKWAADKSMIDGTARYLKPNDNAPRGEVVEYLWKAAGSPEPTVGNPFTDVAQSDSYYKAVLWAYEQGITAGTSATTFSPKATCTRAQVVTFLWRSMNGGTADAPSAFSDVSDTAYYANPVAWAVKLGITAGTSATTFSPDATCTRAQILTFLWRADQ